MYEAITKNRSAQQNKAIIYYDAMIKPVILYGSAVWTVTSKENLNRVLKLQKKAAQVILDMGTSARSVDMFKQLDCMPYYDEVKIFKATIAYKRINSESPGYLTNMLKLNSSVNNRVTTYNNLNFVLIIHLYSFKGNLPISLQSSQALIQKPLRTQHTILPNTLWKSI